MSRIGNYSAIGYPVGTEAVSYTGTAGTTAAGVGAHIQRVALYATTDCHIAFGGSTVAATTDDFFLPGGQLAMFVIHPGQYVSAIQSASGGTLYVNQVDT